MAWEYKVIPAPAKGLKAKGIKTPEARFANALAHCLNEMAAEGWAFQRAETLPSEERVGLTGSQTVWRHVLIFRRAVANDAEAEPPVALIEDQVEENAAEVTAVAAATAAAGSPEPPVPEAMPDMAEKATVEEETPEEKEKPAEETTTDAETPEQAEQAEEAEDDTPPRG